MKNYQKLHYQNYYLLKESGEYLAVTRTECFAKGEIPDESNPFKQRWFFDPEAGYAVRLPRNEKGYIIGKRNSSDLKANERSYANTWRCIWASTDTCDQNCDLCKHSYISRTEELDRQLARGFDYEAGIEFNPVLIYEESALGKELFSAVAGLSDEEQRIISLAFSGLTEREAASKLGLPRKTFTYRRDKAVEKLKNVFKNY